MTETQAQILTLLRHDTSGSIAGRLVLGAFLTGRVAITSHLTNAFGILRGAEAPRTTEGHWAALMGALLAKDILEDIVITAEKTPQDARVTFECALIAAEHTLSRPPDKTPSGRALTHETHIYESLAAAFMRRWFWLTPEQRAQVLGTAPSLASHPSVASNDPL